MFVKIGVLQKFHKVHRKTPVLDSLFSKVSGLKACNFIKKRLQNSYFPVKFVKILRTTFFTERLRWLLLFIMGKKRNGTNKVKRDKKLS